MDGSRTSLVAFLFLLSVVPLSIHITYAQTDTDRDFGITPIRFNNDNFSDRFDGQITIIDRVQNVFRDIQTALTFDPLERAKLNLEDAGNNQSIINRSIDSGVPVSSAVEERRVGKLNEALNIVQTNMDSITNSAQLLQDIKFLQDTGELNEIKILYSQVDDVKDADQTTKDEFNAKVNALETYQKYCFGSFDIDDFRPIDETVIPKIEQQCPRIKELNEQFDLEELYMKYKDDF